MRSLVISVLLVLLCGTIVAAAPFRDITSREAKALIDKNPKVFLLDVRTPDEFRQGRIAGAVLIPIGEFERRAKEVPQGRPIIVFCAVGSRSRQVSQYLAQQGYKEVYNMTDGIMGWYRNGLPVAR
ncbi:MAG TPA: rhodanese-like domain-containing protein [Geobacteraceae bacterium]